MRTFILIVAGLISSAGWLHAQSVSPDVIASGGDYFSNSGGSVSWTLGEPMGETYQSANNFLTQGFQQPWDFGTVTNSNQPVNADVYPNPTTGMITVQHAEGYTFRLFDYQGRLVLSALLTAAKQQLTVSSYPSGIYCYSILSASGKSFSGLLIRQ